MPLPEIIENLIIIGCFCLVLYLLYNLLINILLPNSSCNKNKKYIEERYSDIPSLNDYLNRIVYNLSQTINANNSPPESCINSKYGILANYCLTSSLSNVNSYYFYLNGLFKDPASTTYILSGDNTSGYLINQNSVISNNYAACPSKIFDNSSSYSVDNSSSISSCIIKPITLTGSNPGCYDPNFPKNNGNFCSCDTASSAKCNIQNPLVCQTGQHLCNDGLCYPECPSGYDQYSCNTCIPSTNSIAVTSEERIICPNKYVNLNGKCWTYTNASGNTPVINDINGLLYDSEYSIQSLGFSNIFYLNNLSSPYIACDSVNVNIAPFNMSFTDANTFQITFPSVSIIFNNMNINLQPSWNNVRFNLNINAFNVVLNIPAFSANTPPSVLFVTGSEEVYLQSGTNSANIDLSLLQYIILNLVNSSINIVNNSSNNDIPFIGDILNKYGVSSTNMNFQSSSSTVDPFSNYISNLFLTQISSTPNAITLSNVEEDVPVFGWVSDGPLALILSNLSNTDNIANILSSIDTEISNSENFSRFVSVINQFDGAYGLYSQVDGSSSLSVTPLINNQDVLSSILNLKTSLTNGTGEKRLFFNILQIYLPAVLNLLNINSNISTVMNANIPATTPSGWTTPPNIQPSAPDQFLFFISLNYPQSPIYYLYSPNNTSWTNSGMNSEFGFSFSNGKIMYLNGGGGNANILYGENYLSTADSNATIISTPANFTCNNVYFSDTDNLVFATFQQGSQIGFYYATQNIYTNPNWQPLNTPNSLGRLVYSNSKMYFVDKCGNLFYSEYPNISWTSINPPTPIITTSCNYIYQQSGNNTISFNGYDNVIFYIDINFNLWYATGSSIYTSQPYWTSTIKPSDAFYCMGVCYSYGAVALLTTSASSLDINTYYTKSYTNFNWVKLSQTPYNTNSSQGGLTMDFYMGSIIPSSDQAKRKKPTSPPTKEILGKLKDSGNNDFICNGAEQNFTVPSGYNTLTFYAWGAGGGGPVGMGNRGGNGAFISGTINVNPNGGDIIGISVGKGGSGVNTSNPSPYGGGGSAVNYGGSGGGSTVLSLNNNIFTVVGGGGGAGFNNLGSGNGGWAASIQDTNAQNGSPGISGGRGSSINTSVNPPLGGIVDGQVGTSGFGVNLLQTNGVIGQGGSGGGTTSNGGGGGGGGYIGGGGGASQGTTSAVGAGGGGGCSFVNSNVTPLFASNQGVTPYNELPFNISTLTTIPGLGGTNSGVGQDGFVRIILSNVTTTTLPPIESTVFLYQNAVVWSPLQYAINPNNITWVNTNNTKGYTILKISNGKLLASDNNSMDYISDFANANNTVPVSLPTTGYSSNDIMNYNFDDTAGNSIITMTDGNNQESYSVYIATQNIYNTPNWALVALPTIPPDPPGDSDFICVGVDPILSNNKIIMIDAFGNLYCNNNYNNYTSSNWTALQPPIAISNTLPTSGDFYTSIQFDGYNNILFYLMSKSPDFTNYTSNLWYATENIYTAPTWIPMTLPLTFPGDVFITDIIYSKGKMCLFTTSSSYSPSQTVYYTSNYLSGVWSTFSIENTQSFTFSDMSS